VSKKAVVHPRSRQGSHNPVSAFRRQRNFALQFLPKKYFVDMWEAPRGSSRNAVDIPRNYVWFWRQLLKHSPELFSPDNKTLISREEAPKVDETWVKYIPLHALFMDAKLIHHHAEHGPLAYPIPKPVHQIWDVELHHLKWDEGIRRGL
jgi:hypothetical protein